MRKKKVLIVIVLFVSSFYYWKTTGFVAIPHKYQLTTFSFADLGYSTTTYHYNEQLNLSVNCSGSNHGIYYVRVYLHITADTIQYTYQANDNPEKNGGCFEKYFYGWKNRSFDPGFFSEGMNDFKIIVYNYPLSSEDPDNYLTVFSDSFLEITTENDTQDTTQTEDLLQTTTTEQVTTLSEKLPLTTATTEIGPFFFQNGSSLVELFFGVIIGCILTIGAFYLYKRSKSYSSDVSWISKNKQSPSSISSPTSNVTPQYRVREPTSTQECPICRQEINETEPFAICPFCQNRFHVPHFEESLKVTGKCPICQQEIIHG